VPRADYFPKCGRNEAESATEAFSAFFLRFFAFLGGGGGGCILWIIIVFALHKKSWHRSRDNWEIIIIIIGQIHY
jgi:hypothetical protein